MTMDPTAFPPRLTLRPHTEWFHGNPERIETLPVGATVTPIAALARAFAHKPGKVEFNVAFGEDGAQTVTIRHTGARPGFLYRVQVADPVAQLEPRPKSPMAEGEEMLARVELALELIEELPPQPSYSYTERPDA